MDRYEDGLLSLWTKSTKPRGLIGSGVFLILVWRHQVNDQVNTIIKG